jgi:hypothetical protein
MKTERIPEWSINRNKSASYETKIVIFFGLSFAYKIQQVTRDPNNSIGRLIPEREDASLSAFVLF